MARLDPILIVGWIANALWMTMVFLYLTIAVALCVTHSHYVSPCTTFNSNIIRGNIDDTPLVYVVANGLAWPIKLWRHVIYEGMPLWHFVMASDCEWQDQPPPDARLFDRANGVPCPDGTLPFKSDRCQIPTRESGQKPEPSYEKDINRDDRPWSCPGQWIASQVASRLPNPAATVICTLPSLQKDPGKLCPVGFVAWQPDDSSSIVPKQAVCRLGPT